MTDALAPAQAEPRAEDDDEFERAFFEFAGVKPPETTAGDGGDDEDARSAMPAGNDGAADDDGQDAATPPADAAPAATAGAPAAPAPAVAPAAAVAAPPVQAAVEPARQADATDDELLQLLPEDKREALRVRLHRGASEAGRQAALQRHLAESRREVDRLTAELAEARTPKEKLDAKAAVDAAKADEKKVTDKLSEEFPELSEPLNIRIKEVVQGLLPPPDQPAAKPAPVEAPAGSVQPEEVSADVRYANEYAQLFKAFPDWQADVRSENYEKWIERQPAGVKALGDSERVEDAVYLLTQFNRAKAEATANVKGNQGSREALKEHVAPRRNPGPRTEGTAAGDSFEDHFNAFASQRKGGGG